MHVNPSNFTDGKLQFWETTFLRFKGRLYIHIFKENKCCLLVTQAYKTSFSLNSVEEKLNRIEKIFNPHDVTKQNLVRG